MTTLETALENRRKELCEEARRLANEEAQARQIKARREQDAVNTFKEWLSSEYDFDASSLDVSAKARATIDFDIALHFNGGLIYLLVPFSSDIKGPIFSDTLRVWHVVDTEGYYADYANFLDAAYYALHSTSIHSPR